MTICEYCGREMNKVKGCNLPEIKINGKWYKRIRCEEEKCPDCGASEDKIHHYGCDNEKDPSEQDIQLIGVEIEALRNKTINKEIQFVGEQDIKSYHIEMHKKTRPDIKNPESSLEYGLKFSNIENGILSTTNYLLMVYFDMKHSFNDSFKGKYKEDNETVEEYELPLFYFDIPYKNTDIMISIDEFLNLKYKYLTRKLIVSTKVIFTVKEESKDFKYIIKEYNISEEEYNSKLIDIEKFDTIYNLVKVMYGKEHQEEVKKTAIYAVTTALKHKSDGAEAIKNPSSIGFGKNNYFKHNFGNKEVVIELINSKEYYIYDNRKYENMEKKVIKGHGVRDIIDRAKSLKGIVVKTDKKDMNGREFILLY